MEEKEMDNFTKTILECCNRTIESNTYQIQQQEDIPVAREVRIKANFIKAMLLLNNDETNSYEAEKIIDEIRLDAESLKPSDYDKTINILKTYCDSVNGLLD